ncbi:MAG: SCO family protein [Rhodoferax sp.]|uniref:SCO family protein n=1 Tax=Rhodoferax sp. TaxID=50421 RepID=UPI001B3CFE05|nr:SCO family protein [Rhodoferax sp.]MBP9904036.1 SCO family protein [Rhodoferax sp.]
MSMRFDSIAVLGSSSRRAWLGGLAVAAMAWGCAPSDKPVPHSLDITGAAYGKDFSLTDAQGQARTLADFRGKVVLLFFGFTQCPDVCPTALAAAVEVLQTLGEDASKVQVLFVSLDPERDTPAILQAYVSSFHPSFIGLSTDLPRTTETAAYFKVYFRKVPMGGSYTLDHSAITYVFDTAGQLRLASPPGQQSARLAADVRQLLNAPA